MLKKKFIVLTLMSFGVAVILFMIQAFLNVQNVRNHEIDEIRTRIQIVYDAMDVLDKKAHTGQMNFTDARNTAKELFKWLSYENSEYFWIHDSLGVIIAHPDASIRGKQIQDFKTKDGKSAFAEFVDFGVDSRNGVIVEYIGPTMHGSKYKSTEKISVIRTYEPWSWTIGSGVYKSSIYERVINDLMILLGVYSLAWAGFTTVLWVFVYPLIKGYELTSNYLNCIVNDHYQFDIQYCNRTDELGHTMKEIRRIRDYLLKEQHYATITDELVGSRRHDDSQ